MSPSIRRFLIEAADAENLENNHLDRLMQYLDENLTMMSSMLSQEKFEQVLSSTFDKICHIIMKAVENGMEVDIIF